jgi:nitronate monooxygenase
VLHTRICELFEIEVPIVLAGMGEASTPRLAAAVSNAGGLGVLGAAACSPKRLRRWIAEVRSLTDRPFGVDTLLPASVRRGSGGPGGGGPSPQDRLPEYRAIARDFLEREGLADVPRLPVDPDEVDAPPLFTKAFFEAQMEVVIDERVPVYAAGLGDPGPWLERLHRNGTKVLSVVGAVRHARKVRDSGVDVIVAQGHDGGGHNAAIGTLALIPQVRDAVGDLPVLGAGGITDGRGVAAALMLGAEGAWVGTAFLATEEAGIPDYQKKALVDGYDQSTVVSRSISGKPARLLRTKWTDLWSEIEQEPLPMPFQSAVSGPVMVAAEAAQRADIYAGFCGQGLGMIHGVREAREVLRDIVTQAEACLRNSVAVVGAA